jgi:hypothetical protein
MSSSGREEIVEVFGAFGADLKRLCGLSFEVLTTPERLGALEHLERMTRQLRAPQHELINQLDAQAGEEELGGSCAPRWPTGCVSPKPKLASASTKPRISGNAGHSPVNRWRRS